MFDFLDDNKWTRAPLLDEFVLLVVDGGSVGATFKGSSRETIEIVDMEMEIMDLMCGLIMPFACI